MEVAATLRITSVVIQLILGFNLVFPVVLYALSIVKRKKRISRNATNTPERDYAIIVTAYEQTDAVPAAVDSILGLNYNNYMVYVVVDKCDGMN